MKQYLVYFGRYVEVTHSPTQFKPYRYRSRQGDFFLSSSVLGIRSISLFDTRLEAIRYILQLERSGYYRHRYMYHARLRLPFDYEYCLRLIHRFYPEDFI